jgi:ribonuclease J
VHKPDNIPYVTTLSPKNHTVRVIALGGLGEIGMNCMAIEYYDEIILVDCGQMMPDEEMLGVDYVIPDISYLLSRKDQVKGIVITHAHEDHVGGLPYILPQLPDNLPVYSSEFTIALLKEKIKEHNVRPNFKQMSARKKFNIGRHFVIEPISVTHSIIDAFGLAITTPIGTIIHTGDFKIDPAPTDGVNFDFHAFSRYAEGSEDGVLLLLSDSTNADRDGTCPSEASVIPTLDRLIREAKSQIIFSCFASSLHRIQTVLNLAARYGRTVFPAGLNMERNIRVAAAIKAIEIPCAYVSNLDRLKTVPPEKRLILTTGSQGEPLAGLNRMALDSHRAVKVEEGDTVILSARLIPGNEKSIYRLINHLTRRGARVFHAGNTSGVHVSGHAYREEMQHMINLVNPRFFTPVHGEFRHLHAHAQIARDMGLVEGEVNVMENGDCLEVTPNEARIVAKVPHGRIFVDGKGIGDVEEVVIRDRKYLSEDGVVIVIMSVDRETGDVLEGPIIHSRGFVDEENNAKLLHEAANVVLETYQQMNNEAKEEGAVVQATIKKALRAFIKGRLDRFPVILVMVMEV